MKLFDIFKRKETRPEIIVDDQTLYRMLYETMSPYIKLKRDSDMLDVITEGYEQSPDVFAITSKVSTMYSQVPFKVFQGEKEIESGPIEAIFENNPADYTFTEFRRDWELFNMITGNAIVYYLKDSLGKRIIHFQLAPSQHVEIEYGDFINPIKGYKLDIYSGDKIIPPDNIWHVRAYANLDYRQGKNIMGISPIKVAAKIVNTLLFGNELTENNYKRGMPPGILTKKDQIWDLKQVKEQREDMEAVWEKKYAQRSRSGKPIFSVGDLNWIPIGFSSMKDLQVTEVYKMGLRTLCNMWGIPSRVMNDMEGGSYTKDKEDRKAIYTNRIIPDNKMFWDGINKLIKNTGVRYEPDYSNIPELQEDKKETAEIFRIGWEADSVTVNEFREVLQLEPDPAKEDIYKSDLLHNDLDETIL